MLPLLTIDTIIDAWAGAGNLDAHAFIRLVLAAIAGALIGMEREVRGREAGFRTNALVCIGSALVMVVSCRMTTLPFVWNHVANIQVDPSRIAYGVMTGIGFLGAGAILRSGPDVKGLTTAAALWCVAAIGLGFGAGLYSVAASTTAVVLLILWGLHYVETIMPRECLRKIIIRAPYSAAIIDELTRRFTSADCRVLDVGMTRDPASPDADITLFLSFRKQSAYRQLQRDLLAETQFPTIFVGQI